jgi:predicted MFS family arabinose efflux permease
MRESPLTPLFQNRACGFPRTRLLSYCTLVMGTLHLCGNLVMAMSVDAHEVVPLVVLMVSIPMMYFQYVLVSKEKLAVATFAFLLFEPSGFSW